MVESGVTVVQGSVNPGDPHICSDSSDRLSVIFSVYESLVSAGGQGVYYPSLAVEWSMNDDASKWRFKIREDVRFHNGDQMVADDVVATLERVVDPSIGGAFGTQGVYASYIGDAEIEADGAKHVNIHLTEPMADLLDLLVAMPIGPESELDSLPDEYSGTGPYRVEKMTESETVISWFKEYWGREPKYDSIEWLSERKKENRVDYLYNREADLASRIGLEGKERLEDESNLYYRKLQSSLCIIFMFNVIEGVCKDPRVRQALNYGINLSEIIEQVKGGAAIPLNGFLTPHHFGYDPETPVYIHDAFKAETLLREAGYKDGLELTVDIPSAMPDEAPQLAEMMTEYYSSIGVTMNTVVHRDRAAYAEMVRDKKINDLCCFDSSPLSTFRVLREKIHSSHRGPWWQGYHNPQVNALIEQAQRTPDQVKRRTIYRQIYRMITADAPWIFLYRPTSFWGVNKKLEHWKPRFDGTINLMT
jgi:peptide/nickel transport system substrate-binding protein